LSEPAEMGRKMIFDQLASVHFREIKDGTHVFLPLGNLGGAYEINPEAASSARVKVRVLYGLMFAVLFVCGWFSLVFAMVGLIVYMAFLVLCTVAMARGLKYMGRWRHIGKTSGGGA